MRHRLTDIAYIYNVSDLHGFATSCHSYGHGKVSVSGLDIVAHDLMRLTRDPPGAVARCFSSMRVQA